jgi:hypothetical protein
MTEALRAKAIRMAAESCPRQVMIQELTRQFLFAESQREDSKYHKQYCFSCGKIGNLVYCLLGNYVLVREIEGKVEKQSRPRG